MSAYVVDRNHIKYLIEAAVGLDHGPFHWTRPGQSLGSIVAAETDGLVKAGQMLWDENIRSVKARYEDWREAGLPGPVDEYWLLGPEDFIGARYVNFKPVQVLKACDCYEYQSCETDDWRTTEAYNFIEALRGLAVSKLPGYEAAAWGAPKEKLQRIFALR